MASHTRHLFDFVEVRQDTITHGALACENMLFIQHLAIVASSDGIAVYKLKDKVPESLAGLDIEVQEHCFSYIGAAHEKGLTISLAAIFPFHNLDEDFDFQEIGAQSWQPKLDVLTERFDALDVINSLDQELIDEFVEQLSAGGDAFALIDAKVLTETTRATGVEAANASAILAEIAAREADVDAEAAAALGARATIQAEVDQNEADIAQEIVDRVADVQAEETRALGVESTNATAILTETNNRIAAVSAEAGSRAVAIAAAVANLIDSAPGALDTLNELAAALGDDASFSASVTTSLAGKQGQTIYLDAVNSAQRTTEQLQSLDTTTSIATHLSDEETRALAAEAVNAGLVAAEQTRAQGVESTNATAISNESSARATAVSGVQSDLDDVELVLGDRTAVQIARVDATGPIQAQLDARALKAAPVFTGSAASFQGGLGWSNGKTMQGVDIVGNNHLLLRTIGGANLRLEPAGVVSCSSDISVQNAKKVKFSEATGNGVHSVSLKAPDSVAADVDFVLPGADGTTGQVLQTDGSGALSFVTAGGLAAASNEVISGNWTFQGPVTMNKPLYRTPFELIDTVYVWNYNTNTNNIITADHSAYLYGSASSNVNDSYFRLATNAPVGSRIAIYTYSTYAARNKSYIGTQSNLHTIFKEGSTTHRNGWTGQGASETMKESSANWVHLNCNDKRIFHKITTTTWTY